MDANLLSAFMAYDIRGRVPEQLTLELVRQVGLAFVAEFSPKTVCIGYDMRHSSLDFARVLTNALEDGGADVVNIGLCGTEEVYFATFSQGFDGGIMITASHNPKGWNGMKFVGKNATPIHSGSGLQNIKARIAANDLPIAITRGTSRKAQYRNEYVQHMLNCLGQGGALKPLKIVANAGNGCAWLVMEELLKYVPCTFIPIQETPDGDFPNGVPNPLLPENRNTTSQAVLHHNADLGIAWDGDFDRCFFFDEKGNFIESYYIIGLLAEELLTLHPKEKIVHDPRLTWNTQHMVRQAGGTPIESRTGHAYMKERMRLENALYGGEMSAHHYFRDFCFCDSGMLVWLLICQLISRKNTPLSQLVAERIQAFPVSGEINRKVKNPEAAIAAVLAEYGQGAESITHIDGVSIAYPDWRCNIRQSNTEPLLRLNVETRANPELLQEKTRQLLQLIEKTGQVL